MQYDKTSDGVRMEEYMVVIIASLLAVAAMFTELFTKKGWDTITASIFKNIFMIILNGVK